MDNQQHPPNDYRVYLTNLQESISLNKNDPPKALDPFTVQGFSSHSPLPSPLTPQIRRFEYHSPSKRDVLQTTLLPPHLPIMRLLADAHTRALCQSYKLLDYSTLPADSVCSHFYSAHMARLRKSLGLFLPSSPAIELSVSIFLDDHGWLFPVNTEAGFFNILYLVINNLPYPERLQRRFLIPVMLLPDLAQCAVAIEYNKDSQSAPEYSENYNFLASCNATILAPLVRLFDEMSTTGFYLPDSPSSQHPTKTLVKVHWTHTSSNVNLLLGHDPSSSHLTLPLDPTPIDSRFYTKIIEPKINALLLKISRSPATNPRHWNDINSAYGFRMASALLGSSAPGTLDLCDSFPLDLSRTFEILCRVLRFLDPESMSQYTVDKDALEDLYDSINKQTPPLVLGQPLSPQKPFTPQHRAFLSHILPILPYWLPSPNPLVQAVASIALFLKCLALNSCPVSFLPICSTVLALLQNQYNRLVDAADLPATYRLHSLPHLPGLALACGPLRDYMAFDLAHADPALTGDAAQTYDLGLSYLPGGKSYWARAEEVCMARFLNWIVDPPRIATDRSSIAREPAPDPAVVDDNLRQFVASNYSPPQDAQMDEDPDAVVLRALKSFTLPQTLPPISSGCYVRINDSVFKVYDLLERFDPQQQQPPILVVVKQVQNLRVLPLPPTVQGLFDYAVDQAAAAAKTAASPTHEATQYRGDIGVGFYSYEQQLGPKQLVQVDESMVHLIVLASDRGVFFIDPTLALQIQTHQKTIYI